MDLVSQVNIKPIYRITGTPENFLTGLRHFTWGFNNKPDWNRLLPGDIIYFHCKGSDSKFLKHVPPSVIGMGVVGTNFFEDTTPLWIDEKVEAKSYPYRFSFSEICLFAGIQVNDDWDSQSFDKRETTTQVLQGLVANGIPLGELTGFPHMGSYSRVNAEPVRKHLLSLPRQLTFYKNLSNAEVIFKPSTKLTEITSKTETLRYSTSLTIFEDVQRKILNKKSFTKEYNPESLYIAESRHHDILSYLIDVLKDKGYVVMQNNHIDLFAHNPKNALLIEAKSTENDNFIPQSRKGIAQLFEYNYFDLSNYKQEKDLAFSNEFKVLATSRKPITSEYVRFINSLDIRTIAVRDKAIAEYGESINLYSL